MPLHVRRGAFRTIALHAAKYPSTPCAGLLVGAADDAHAAVPLVHGPALGPAAEAGIHMVRSHADRHSHARTSAAPQSSACTRRRHTRPGASQPLCATLSCVWATRPPSSSPDPHSSLASMASTARSSATMRPPRRTCA